MENVVVYGLGLIGGSMALALKNDKRTIIGIDANESHAKKALELGIVNRLGGDQDIATADVIIIAIPVNVAPKVTLDVLDKIKPEALVYDVGSIKELICIAVEEHVNRVNFVAAHPIAGTEYSGPEAAFKQLFINKKNIVCESEKSSESVLKKALNLFEELQMTTSFMDAKAHDKHIAYVSHLSHISSFMLGKTVLEIEKDEASIFTMAGSGFASTVRLSKSSPATWSPIFIQNKSNILKSLEEYIKNLNQFKELLIQDAEKDLHEVMKSTHHLKNILSEIK